MEEVEQKFSTSNVTSGELHTDRKKLYRQLNKMIMI